MLCDGIKRSFCSGLIIWAVAGAAMDSPTIAMNVRKSGAITRFMVKNSQ
jgi:hypothetical protein